MISFEKFRTFISKIRGAEAKPAETYRAEEKKEFDLTFFPHLKKVFIDSFKHSQGDGKVLQKHIFEYLHTLYPDFRISESCRQELIYGSDSPREKILDKVLGSHDGYMTTDETTVTPAHKNKDVYDIDIAIARQVSALQEALSGSDTDFNLYMLIEEIVERDYKFVMDQNRDFSYLYTHGLQSRTTGVHEFDTMYGQIRPLVEKILKTENTSNHIGVESYTKLKQLNKKFSQRTAEIVRVRIP